MKQLFLFLVSLWALSATAGDPDSCVRVTETIRGKNCGKPGSVEIKFVNTCSEPMDMRFCLEYGPGKWNCGARFKEAPGKEVSWWTCEGSGAYKLWARTPGSNAAFPEEKGLYRSVGNAVYAVASGENRESACRRVLETPGAQAPCECEPGRDATVTRCRTPAAVVRSELNPVEIKPFPSDQFARTSGKPAGGKNGSGYWTTSTATGKSMDEACTSARRMAGRADAACECESRGQTSICRVRTAAEKPETGPIDSMKGRIRDQFECKPEAGEKCTTPRNGGPGVRG